jgi:hypothetical protein
VVSSRFRVRAQAAATKQRAAHLGGGGRRPARDHACGGAARGRRAGTRAASGERAGVSGGQMRLGARASCGTAAGRRRGGVEPRAGARAASGGRGAGAGGSAWARVRHCDEATGGRVCGGAAAGARAVGVLHPSRSASARLRRR